MVRPVHVSSPAEGDSESAALRHWREQEAAPMPGLGDDETPVALPEADDPIDAFPSGWWILPVLVLSCLAWGGLGAAILF